jgi:hypothetical protein
MYIRAFMYIRYLSKCMNVAKYGMPQPGKAVYRAVLESTNFGH